MPGYHIDRITEDIKREIVAILRELKRPADQRYAYGSKGERYQRS